MRLMMESGSEDWKECISRLENPTLVVQSVTYVVCHLYSCIKKEEEKIRDGKLNIIFIAHGSVSTELYPSQLYYLNRRLKNIRMYSPWGCSVDASVVYGIATGLLKPKNRYFHFDPQNILPCYYEDEFNNLPRSGAGIPTPRFSKIKKGDEAYGALCALHNELKVETNDLIITFCDDTIPLPEVPLCVVTNALALIGHVGKLDIDFQYASCLSWKDGTSEIIWNPAQYCFIGRQPSHLMSCDLPCNPPRKFVDSYRSFQRSVFRKHLTPYL